MKSLHFLLLLLLLPLNLIIAQPDGTCLDFEGDDDYVELGKIPFYTNSFTVEFWIRTRNSGMLFHVREGERNTAISAAIVGNGQIGFGIRNKPANSGGAFVMGGHNITDGNWHHIACVKGDDDFLYLYIDGKEAGRSKGVIGDFEESSYDVVLGVNVNTSPRYFAGRMDELRIWNRAKSYAEILKYKDVPLQGNEPGLVSYYTFNQGKHELNNSNDNILWDLKNSHNGTLKNFKLHGTTSNFLADEFILRKFSSPIKLKGPEGQSLRFDGENDYVDLGKIPFYAKNYTIEGWIKPETQGTIFHVRDGDRNSAIALYLHDNGNLRFVIRNKPANSGGHTVLAETNLLDGKWHHFAAVKDRNNKIHLIIDGDQKFESKSRVGDFKETPYEVVLGVNVPTSPRWYKGSMDEIRLWSVARSDDEIKSNKDKVQTGNEKGLVAYYKFNQGTACGINEKETKLDCQNPSYTGVLNNFSLAGNASNFKSSSAVDKSPYGKDNIAIKKIPPRENTFLRETDTDFKMYPKPVGDFETIMVFVDFPNANQKNDGITIKTEDVANHLLGGGKVKQFLHDQSYGKMNHNVKIVNGWKRMGKNIENYTDDHGIFSTGALHRSYIKEAVELFPDINFNTYDAVYIVAYENKNIYLSPTFSNPLNDNQWAVKAKNGTIHKAVTFGWDSYQNRWTNLVHELGHVLGLPDLYPIQMEGEPKIPAVVKQWALMGHNLDAANFLGWHRHKFEWLPSTKKTMHYSGSKEYILQSLNCDCENALSMIVVNDENPDVVWVVELIEPAYYPNDFDNDYLLPNKEGVMVYAVWFHTDSGRNPIVIIPGPDGLDFNPAYRVGDILNHHEVPFTMKILNKFSDEYYHIEITMKNKE